MTTPQNFPCEPVFIPLGQGAQLAGDLCIPPGALGVVVFAHGSGSSRYSPRNRYVAGELQHAGLATLLLDLLTEAEEQLDIYTRQYRFDIGLLAERLVASSEWLAQQPPTRGARASLFWGQHRGCSGPGGGSAASRPDSGGGFPRGAARPGGQCAAQGQGPHLLVVGGWDEGVLELNQRAFEQLTCEKKLVVVPEATHLFEEPGKLEEVARLARDWFVQHLTPAKEAGHA